MAKLLKNFNLKSLFVVEDETIEKKPNPSTPEKPATATKPSAPTAPPPAAPAVSTVGKIDQRFLDILFKALEANNLQGLDYLEFRQSLQALSAMPMDDATRYKSALAMAGSMGATADHLVATAKHYLSVLEKEELQFQKALEQQNHAKVGSQQEEIKRMETTITEKAAQIKQLTDEISQLQTVVKQKTDEISEAVNKINQTKADFELAYQTVRGQITTDIANVQHYSAK